MVIRMVCLPLSCGWSSVWHNIGMLVVNRVNCCGRCDKTDKSSLLVTNYPNGMNVVRLLKLSVRWETILLISAESRFTSFMGNCPPTSEICYIILTYAKVVWRIDMDRYRADCSFLIIQKIFLQSCCQKSNFASTAIFFVYCGNVTLNGRTWIPTLGFYVRLQAPHFELKIRA